MQFFTLLLAALPAVSAVPSINKRQTDNTIPGSWIVQLNDDAALGKVLSTVKLLAGVKPKFQYDSGSFKGFSFKGSDAVVDLLAKVGALKSIEPDTLITTLAPIAEPSELQDRALTTQSNAQWGLGRISHLNNNTSPYSFIYDTSAGAGTYVYVIDTGINVNHTLFQGRAINGANFVDGESIDDGNGHGTHCSGSVGSSNYGVAKKTNLIGVKALNNNGSGTTSQLLAGINWVINDAKSRGGVSKSIISMSIGGGFSSSANNGVKSATDAGIFVAVAAGNQGDDAGNYSPGSEPSACTVGSIDNTNTRAASSNYGSLVDIHAPGVSIKSTWIGSTTAVNTISGTSMATPHVAGLAAYLIGLGQTYSPADMCAKIQSMSIKDKVQDVKGSPNYIAYNGNGA